MWPFKRKKSKPENQYSGPVCSFCRSRRTEVVIGHSSGQPDYVKSWRGQRFLTCRCLDCGEEFYAQEPEGGVDESVYSEDRVIDNEDELRIAEEELKKQTEDEGDHRCR